MFLLMFLNPHNRAKLDKIVGFSTFGVHLKVIHSGRELKF